MSTASTKELGALKEQPNYYIGEAGSEISDDVKLWITTAVSGLPLTARIFAIGSKEGHTADYIESLGYDVECAATSPLLVTSLLEKGFNARLHDAILDPIIGSYDLVFANTALIHFTHEEVILVTSKALTALKKRGRFIFGLKRRAEERWPQKKGNIKEESQSWSLKEIETLLKNTGFSTWTIDKAATPYDNANEWYQIIAYK